MEAKDRIFQVAADLGLSMTADFVPFSQSRNKSEKHPSLNWRVTLVRGAELRDGKAEGGREILTTDYMAGCAHAPGYKQGDRSLYQDDLVRWECEHGKRGLVMYSIGGIVQGSRDPLRPDFADVLYSLASDSDVLNSGTFEDWARDLGYDPDSRKAESIYRACLAIALQLRNGIGEDGLTKLRDACQDY